jgi:uroporphyrinogen decarboxylase
MNSKERVIRTLKFDKPDRIPIHLWTLPTTWDKYGDSLGNLLKKYGQDMVKADYHDPIVSADIFKPGEYKDGWGCVWKNIQKGMMGEVKTFPLADYRNIKNYKAPVNLLDKGWENVDNSIKENRDKFTFGGVIKIFERMQFIRGIENLYIDIMEESDEF